MTEPSTALAHTSLVQTHLLEPYAAGPRVDRRLLDTAVALDDRSQPMAETYRRLRATAAAMGVPRPSYDRVRRHLRAARRRELDARAVREHVLALAFNTRRADAVIADLLELVGGVDSAPRNTV